MADIKLAELPQGAKFDTGKLRYDLIPPEALEGLALVYTIGANKYADRNWEKGISFGRVFAALMRHAWKWWLGEERDPDGQHHLDSVAWCAFALRTYIARSNMKQFDDRNIIDQNKNSTPQTHAKIE